MNPAEAIKEWTQKAKQFYFDVRSEMKKGSWPSRQEVTGTTLVVIIAVFFFGLYLGLVDYLLAQLAQPDWVRQLRDRGTLDRKRVCRTFSYCTALMRAKDHPLGQYPTGCPPFDKDAYGEVWKEVQQLHKRT